LTQYKAGLTNQLTVLNADTNALSADESVANLKMNRRDQQIALAQALGGGYTEDPGASAEANATTGAHPNAASQPNASAARPNPVVAAR
jgi:hypothetical protein